MDPVVHFEMPYNDAKRASQFYATAFGWQMVNTGPQMMDYVLATTAPSTEAGPKKPGSINGGLYPVKPDWPAQYPSVTIAVDDIAASMARVSAAGGKVLGEPVDIPGVGKYVSFTDTEGNRVTMLEPIPRPRARSAGGKVARKAKKSARRGGSRKPGRRGR